MPATSLTEPAVEAMPYQPPTAGQYDDPRIESDMPLAVSATPTADELAAGQELKQKNDDAVAISYAHMRVLQPSGQVVDPANPSVDTYRPEAGQDGMMAGDQYVNGGVPAPSQPVTPQPNPAILELANNDDLDIATLARQAHREINKAPDEVEIRLH